MILIIYIPIIKVHGISSTNLVLTIIILLLKILVCDNNSNNNITINSGIKILLKVKH